MNDEFLENVEVFNVCLSMTQCTVWVFFGHKKRKLRIWRITAGLETEIRVFKDILKPLIYK